MILSKTKENIKTVLVQSIDDQPYQLITYIHELYKE